MIMLSLELPLHKRCSVEVYPPLAASFLLLAKRLSPSPGLSPEVVGGNMGFRIAHHQLDPNGMCAEKRC